MGVIYKATNLITNYSYIGQTINFEKRKKEHIWAAFNNSSQNQTNFHKALKEYGENNFKWEIIEECLQDQLNEREEYWINYYHTYIKDPLCQGYNMTKGGNHDVVALQNWRKEYPQKAKDSAVQGYSIMKEILKNNPEKEKNRQIKATENMKKYVQEHYEEWKQHSYNTYLKHKEQVDEQFKNFHKQQSKKVICLETGIIYESANEASRQTHISQGNISACCRGERLSAGKGLNKEKLHWKYIEN